MNLRPYQIEANRLVLDYIDNEVGNPCVVLPGGAGKSICIANDCQSLLKRNNQTKILMLTSSRELIGQNEDKLLKIWPLAPVGIYSAGLRRKEIGFPITFAGVQSIGKKAHLLGHIDFIIVDECDTISHKEEGLYRKLINDLKVINPNIRVIGYTATPYRMGHGLIIDKPAIFDKLLYPEGSSIIELVNNGFLSRLISKATPTKLSVAGVKKRGGEYIESELQKAVDKIDLNTQIVKQVIERNEGRKHFLFFCAGIEHAKHMAEALNACGVSADFVSSYDSTVERDRKIDGFKSGKITALTNNNILTVGFDFPDIDLIAFCRPTMSPRLYEQMAFRGTRLKSHIDNCLCLDFAGVISQHGAITAVKTPAKKGQGDGIAPSKECPECFEIIAAQSRSCPECGYVFPIQIKREFHLRNDDIFGGSEPAEMDVASWKVADYVGKTSGKNMLKVTYYPKFGVAIDEYLCIYHDGYAAMKANKVWHELRTKGKPDTIKFIKEGKYFRVIERKWIDKLTINN